MWVVNIYPCLPDEVGGAGNYLAPQLCNFLSIAQSNLSVISKGAPAHELHLGRQ